METGQSDSASWRWEPARTQKNTFSRQTGNRRASWFKKGWIKDGGMGVSLYSVCSGFSWPCMPDGEGPSSPRWAPLHARTTPASLYLNTQCGQTSSARVATPFTSNTPDAPLLFHPSHLHLHYPSAFLLSLFCVSFQPCSREKNHLYGTLLRQQTHTQPLFFHHNTSHLSSPNSSSLFFFCDPTDQQVHPTPLTHSFICYLFLIISTNTSSPFFVDKTLDFLSSDHQFSTMLQNCG